MFLKAENEWLSCCHQEVDTFFLDQCYQSHIQELENRKKWQRKYLHFYIYHISVSFFHWQMTSGHNPRERERDTSPGRQSLYLFVLRLISTAITTGTDRLQQVLHRSGKRHREQGVFGCLKWYWFFQVAFPNEIYDCMDICVQACVLYIFGCLQVFLSNFLTLLFSCAFLVFFVDRLPFLFEYAEHYCLFLLVFFNASGAAARHKSCLTDQKPNKKFFGLQYRRKTNQLLTLQLGFPSHLQNHLYFSQFSHSFSQFKHLSTLGLLELYEESASEYPPTFFSAVRRWPWRTWWLGVAGRLSLWRL